MTYSLHTCDAWVNGERCQLMADHIVPCNPDPDGGWIQLPTVTWHEVLPRLWQGGWRGPTGGIVDPDPELFDSVLTLSGSAPHAPHAIEEYRHPIGDSRTIPNLDQVAGWVYERWAVQKKRVLVRCQAGLNRSGLVVGLVLIRTGRTPQQAIDLIRTKRSPYALCNRFFVSHLESLLESAEQPDQ